MRGWRRSTSRRAWRIAPRHRGRRKAGTRRISSTPILSAIPRRVEPPRRPTPRGPAAAFTDEAGRLVWAACGDHALLPAPGNGAWLPNRVQPIAVESSKPEIPADAVLPDATGTLKPVGRGATAAAKVTYRVLLSKF